eukprot:jgi/Botrbrau1/2439/Bobra.0395s0060.1
MMAAPPGATCIIGAGTSGIAAAKALKEKNLPFDWYEKGSRMGGLWWLGNDNGLNTCYEGVTTNTSKSTMAFSDFPFPPEFSQFPAPAEIHSYLEAYAKYFGVGDRCQFNTNVQQVVPLSGGPARYRVELQNEKTGETYSRDYVNVIVANGHHWDPAYPELPGHFSGLLVHAHDYRTNELARGKRCLVLGVGNSGVDIAGEVSQVAENVCLSSRRGAYVLPRFLTGKIPMDAAVPTIVHLMPWRLRQRIMALSLWPILQRQKKAGFPMPHHGLLQAHVTMHRSLISLVEAGLVKPRPAIKSVEGKVFTFVDGTTEEVDLLFTCTGYNVTFPFLGKEFNIVEQEGVRLYRNCVHPDFPGLFFVGLLQPIGAMIPLVEVQGRWIADILTDTVLLPTVPEMLSAIKKDQEVVKQRYVNSKRHMLEVDFLEYKVALQLERCPTKATLPQRVWHYVLTFANLFCPQLVRML